MHGLCLRRAIPASIVCLAIVYIQWALSICLWVQWNIKISIRNLSVKWLQNLYPCCETSGSMYCLHVQLFLNIGIQSTTQMWQKDEHTRVGPEHAFVYSWLSLIPRQKDSMCTRLTIVSIHNLHGHRLWVELIVPVIRVHIRGGGRHLRLGWGTWLQPRRVEFSC